MANNPLIYDNSLITAINAETSLANNGFLNIYSGGQPSLDGGISGTLLVSMAMSATAFATATASVGVVSATANTISNGTAGNTGTAGYFALMQSDNSTVILTGTCGLSGADMNLSTTAIVSGAVVSCSSFVLSQPQT